MRVVNWILLLIFTGLMIFASLGLPDRGKIEAPLNRETSAANTPNAPSYYITHAYEDAHTPNIVTVILADYRGFDTLGEETVILAAGLICLLLLRRRKASDE